MLQTAIQSKVYEYSRTRFGAAGTEDRNKWKQYHYFERAPVTFEGLYDCNRKDKGNLKMLYRVKEVKQSQFDLVNQFSNNIYCQI